MTSVNTSDRAADARRLPALTKRLGEPLRERLGPD
jgi:hypothetical protein